MFEQISGKPIRKIEEAWVKNYKYRTSNYWWVPKGSKVFAENKIENLNWNAQVNSVSTLPDNAKLYFHKTSKFPRHKLELTTYKRKIKESASDFIVCNFKVPVQSTITTTFKHAWETDNTIYVTFINDVDYNIFLNEINVDLSKAVHYTDYKMLTLNLEEEFYLECLQGNHTLPLILDKDLNNLVDNKLERLTTDEVTTLMELIKSRDKENINLALKLFAQFNLTADPLFSHLFLSIYARSFVGISSVLYTNLKKQFQPHAHCWYMYVLNQLKNNQPKDDGEKALLTHLLKDYLVNERLSINTFMEFKNLGYELDMEEMYGQTNSY